MIEIRGLTKRFGPFVAVNNVSFDVPKGQVLGFLGPNGAGKSTSMKMITGFLAMTAGRVSVCGHDVETATMAAQQRMGYLPEGAPAYGEMTPIDFLRFIAEVRGLRGAEAASAIGLAVARTTLAPVLDQPIDTLSKGFKRRVGLAQAILHDPDVLIMDEPTDGLDPNQKHQVRLLIQEMAQDKAIIISTHILEEVEAVCGRALIIDRGQIVADGTPAELMARSLWHDAVTLSAQFGSADDAAGAETALRGLPGAASVERTDDAGLTGFTVFASPRTDDSAAPLAEQVALLAQDNGWQVKALYAEKGRLDEVFRMLTHSDAPDADATGAAQRQEISA
jgi:ABC-2 type transport system ATP-binding protein